MGGETGTVAGLQVGAGGLSPRGRGNRVHLTRSRGRGRSIPAWAGKPAAHSAASRAPGVYPRVGGETEFDVSGGKTDEGLSPRGRGNQAGRGAHLATGRSIPAWAGKPPRPSRSRKWPMVYPRVGGETRWRRSPDVRGLGLSPRGRGNPARPGRRRGGRRSIPAWAGKPAHAITHDGRF